nr:protein FAM3D [Vulpes vulpes]
MRVSGVLRLLALIFALVTTWIFIRSYVSLDMKTIRLPRWLAGFSGAKKIRVVKTKCGLSKPCPNNFFAFKISSGAANVVGPTVCFEDLVIMSPVKNNVGRGLNIALVNGELLIHIPPPPTPESPYILFVLGGAVARGVTTFLSPSDIKLLVKFLKEIPEGALVLVASYDDPGTKMNDETRKLLSSLGSSYAKQLGFRDSWVFLGAKNLKDKSPFEQFLKNNPGTNKYDGWPELLELEGCVPRKVF